MPHTQKSTTQDRTRAEQFLADVEAGAVRRGPPPAGVDPVRYQRARITRLRRVLDDLKEKSGGQTASRRRDARRLLADAKTSLAKAEEAARAGQTDLRGPAQRERDRRAARSRTNGGTGRSVNITDPHSRLMTDGSGGGSVQGYNAQIAVTDDHLILGVHLSQDANDTGCFIPTLTAAILTADLLDKNIDSVLADAGYFTDENLTTPGPDRLIAPGKNRDLAREATNNPSSGPPPDDLAPKDAMQHRLRDPANVTTYKRRSATVEPVIAHLKDRAGLRRFARRGLQAATSELNLAAAAINLTRLHGAPATTG